jgi:hypothetical protein
LLINLVWAAGALSYVYSPFEDEGLQMSIAALITWSGLILSAELMGRMCMPARRHASIRAR